MISSSLIYMCNGFLLTSDNADFTDIKQYHVVLTTFSSIGIKCTNLSFYPTIS